MLFVHVSPLLAYCNSKLHHFVSFAKRFPRFFCSLIYCLHSFYTSLIFQLSFFWIQLLYLPCVSLLGFLALKMTGGVQPPYTKLDLFFTSVSACTSSGLSVIEMEVFSNKQLVVITATMFFGQEVFVSILELTFRMSKVVHSKDNTEKNIQLRVCSHNSEEFVSDPEKIVIPSSLIAEQSLIYSAFKTLIFLIASYLLALHLIGLIFVGWYILRDQDTRKLLNQKHLRSLTFVAFTVISTFSNCGFLPNNENMVAFRKEPGLLLLLTPLIFLGNTLYAPMLRFMIWCLEKMTRRNVFKYILSQRQETGFTHLFSGNHCRLLLATAMALLSGQIVLFCALDWHSPALAGMTGAEKLIGSLFQAANSRHTGESIVDMSILSPATLAIFILMMYLPPYISFYPMVQDDEARRRRNLTLTECLSQSNLTYIVIFVTIICITETENMKIDPLNFSFLFVVVEIVSAYGNVGFSAGYSCQRQLVPDEFCRSVTYGLAGKWTSKGKTVLFLIMLFGRFKRYNLRAGKAWRFN